CPLTTVHTKLAGRPHREFRLPWSDDLRCRGRGRHQKTGKRQRQKGGGRAAMGELGGPGMPPDHGELLVVDDEPFLCDAVAASLRFLGFAVTTAQTGTDALRL